ncbi:GNAT family N-acetyltransferase [Sneathiella glossodoripedis]|uniref:GNAT family N-acetyltransferase n=1 Tax=Sneathiella glossodoripedis TaxID=418853 RepID=UPI000565E384|nr:GNAT family N-acetyltransferase [Sneathiella glossodoripedis]
MTYEVSYFKSTEEDKFYNLIGKLKNETQEKYTHDSLCFWAPQNLLGGYAIFAHTDEEIAATCFLTRRDIQVSGTTYKCYEIGGTNTYPQHQRQGLFSKLVNTAKAIAFDDPEIQLIYGTPNDRSGPGYKKLGYSFIDQTNSQLIILPRLTSIFRKKILKKAPDVKSSDLPIRREVKSINGKIEKLSIDEYIAATRNFRRLNCASEDYLKSRLNRVNFPGENLERAYFRVYNKEWSFFLALKKHKLDFLNLILVSECFHDKDSISFSTKLKLIKLASKLTYSDYDGVYLKDQVNVQQSNLLSYLFSGYVKHRTLPICFLESPSRPSIITEESSREITSSFQMTDCDIG